MGLTTITGAVKNIISLPNISSSAAPQLSGHISNAKAFAQEWLSGHSGTLAASLSAASTVYTQWDASYKHQLDVLISDVSANKSQIKSILQAAEAEASKVRDSLTSALSQIGSDDGRLTSITGDLVGDATNISSQISADKSTIGDLQNRIADAQSKINEYKDRQKWYWFGGPLLYLLIHEIDSLASNVSGYEDQVNAYRQAEGRLEANSQNLSIVMNGVGNWMSAMKIATSSLGALQQGMGSLAANITDVIGGIDGADPSTLGVWMKSQIISIDKGYDQIGSLAKDLAS